MTSNAELIAEAKKASTECLINSLSRLGRLIEKLAAALEAAESKRDASTVEWGVRFRRDGAVETYTTRGRAEARAAGFTRVEARSGKLAREIPPSDLVYGRELVTRTITDWKAAE